MERVFLIDSSLLCDGCGCNGGHFLVDRWSSASLEIVIRNVLVILFIVN